MTCGCQEVPPTNPPSKLTPVTPNKPSTSPPPPPNKPSPTSPTKSPKPPVTKPAPTDPIPEILFSTTRNNRYHFYNTLVEDDWSASLVKKSGFSTRLLFDDIKSIAIVSQSSPDNKDTDVIQGVSLQNGKLLWTTSKFVYSQSTAFGTAYGIAYYVGYNSETKSWAAYGLNVNTGAVAYTRSIVRSFDKIVSTCFSELGETFYAIQSNGDLVVFLLGPSFAKPYLSRGGLPAPLPQSCAINSDLSMVYLGKATDGTVKIYNVDISQNSIDLLWGSIASNKLSEPLSAPSVAINGKIYVGSAQKYYVVVNGEVTSVPAPGDGKSVYGTVVIDQDGAFASYNGEAFVPFKVDETVSVKGFNPNALVIHEESSVLIAFPSSKDGKVTLFDIHGGKWSKSAPKSWAPTLTGGTYVAEVFKDMIFMMEIVETRDASLLLRGIKIEKNDGLSKK